MLRVRSYDETVFGCGRHVLSLIHTLAVVSSLGKVLATNLFLLHGLSCCSNSVY